MQTVYGLTADLGDGSSVVRWFKDKAVVDFLLGDDSPMQDTYYGNEGCPSETLTFPDDLDLAACGFRFSTYEIDEDEDPNDPSWNVTP